MEQLTHCSFEIKFDGIELKIFLEIDNSVFSCYNEGEVGFWSIPSKNLFYDQIDQEYWYLYQMFTDRGGPGISLKHFNFSDQLSEFLVFIEGENFYESYIRKLPTELNFKFS